MNFKTVLLAAAAVVGVAGAAQAADLAKKAPAAANYVKVCDAYGAGFFYIPGSETCLKIGGYVRAEYRAYSHSRNWLSTGYGWTSRGEHGISTRARANLTFDARTATEMGLLRSFIDFELTNDSASNGTVPATLNKAFVQFGGLTAGRATSFFDFWTGNTYGSAFEPAHSDTNINLLAYTFSFGNGISASLSIEDPSTGSAGRRLSDAAIGGTTYAGVKYPDLVANVNISQAWGSAQLMAALHNNYAAVHNETVGGVTTTYGSNKDKWGYAIGAGVTVNLPMLAADDTFSLQAAYTKGAASYAAPDWSAPVADFLIPAVGASIDQISAWSVAAGLTHNWTKTVSTSLEASYLKLDTPNMAADYSQIDLQGNIVWAPVSNLTIGAEVEYRKVDFTSATTARTGFRDGDAVVGLLRVQRNF